jgi:hypothetical protein
VLDIECQLVLLYSAKYSAKQLSLLIKAVIFSDMQTAIYTKALGDRYLSVDSHVCVVYVHTYIHTY